MTESAVACFAAIWDSAMPATCSIVSPTSSHTTSKPDQSSATIAGSHG